MAFTGICSMHQTRRIIEMICHVDILNHVTSLFDIIYYNFKQEFRPFSDFEFVSIFVLDGVVSKRIGKFFQKFPKFLYPG